MSARKSGRNLRWEGRFLRAIAHNPISTRPLGSLVFKSGAGARRSRAGLGIAATATVAFPTLIANLALELAPIRVNPIAAGFVDTPLSASILGDDLDKRRDELRAPLPIRRAVGRTDVARLGSHHEQYSTHGRDV
jgi:NAD(P)-dependent dehydrogenase (short-subunit alcohol dehydrogenase family)